MKKQSNTLFTKFSQAVLTKLTMEVKETLATGFSLPAKRVFTAAELWDIQRRKRGMVQHRFSF